MLRNLCDLFSNPPNKTWRFSRWINTTDFNLSDLPAISKGKAGVQATYQGWCRMYNYVFDMVSWNHENRRKTLSIDTLNHSSQNHLSFPVCGLAALYLIIWTLVKVGITCVQIAERSLTRIPLTWVTCVEFPK